MTNLRLKLILQTYAQEKKSQTYPKAQLLWNINLMWFVKKSHEKYLGYHQILVCKSSSHIEINFERKNFLMRDFLWPWLFLI